MIFVVNIGDVPGQTDYNHDPNVHNGYKCNGMTELDVNEEK